MEIKGYNISMIRGDTETIKISCKPAGLNFVVKPKYMNREV